LNFDGCVSKIKVRRRRRRRRRRRLATTGWAAALYSNTVGPIGE
jgi:xanthine/CO dehydrogenase XdhC/CoxF family maturation factor